MIFSVPGPWGLTPRRDPFDELVSGFPNCGEDFRPGSPLIGAPDNAFVEPEFVRGSIELCPDPANFVPFVRQRSGPKHDAARFLAQQMLFRAQTMPTHDALLTLTLSLGFGIGFPPLHKSGTNWREFDAA